MSTHLYELLRQRAERYPDTTAIGGQQGLVWKSLTSRKLIGLVDRLAEELAALGVTEGDRVVYWLPNHWRTPVYLFATWKLGAIAVPFDREMNPEAGARILTSVEPRLVVAGYGERPAWARRVDITEWWEPGSRVAGPNARAPWSVPSETTAVIVFTSGTTGTPKGVMLTHRNLIFQAEAVSGRVPLDASCRVASILPLSHAFELGTLVYAIMTGAATHYVPSRRGPDIARVLQEQRITHMIVVPQILTLMARTIEEQLQAHLPESGYRALMCAADHLPLSARRRLFWPVHRRLGGQLRLMIAGGAPLPAETHVLWERLGVRILEGYGVTECSPAVALAAPNGGTPLGSVGRPVSGVDVRFSPDGELLVRGANVMAGYWRDPARTAEVMQEDGWYATGDLGTIDEHGNIRVVGRARELIVLPSGMNVWPQDVEEVLRGHPLVKDAAVIAVPTERGGAVLHAYLLPASPSDRATSVDRIVAVGNARLAQHQRVATASWWAGADFPRTALLKVKRYLLPLPDPGRMTAIDSVLSQDDPVGQVLCGIAKASMVQPRQTMAELGLDSLGLVELAMALEEKTGKSIREDSLRGDTTVEGVRAALAVASSDTTAPDSATVHHGIGVAPPLWPYTWGRRFRALAAPFDLLLRYAGSPTVVLGSDHLASLPEQVILAGTHRSFADLPLVRYALAHSGNRRLLHGLITANATGPNFTGPFAWLGVLAFGLHPIDQYRGREGSLRALVRATQAGGGSLLIFPQGTHATTEAELADDASVRFHPGVAHLAKALDAVVVPFGLAGPELVIPAVPDTFHGCKIAGIPVSVRRTPLAIVFGKPLRIEPGETAQTFTARLQEVCFALTRDAERAILDHDASLPALNAPVDREGTSSVRMPSS